MADVDGKGALALGQFQQFTRSLGLAMTKQQLQAVFAKMDKNQTGRVTYEVLARSLVAYNCRADNNVSSDQQAPRIIP